MNAIITNLTKYFIGVACFTSIVTTHSAELSLREEFDRGLLQEEIHQNLEKAIEHYQANIDTYDAQRNVIAMTLYRLAECHRKLGQWEQAAPLYARITKEFPDQQSLVLMSRRFVPEEDSPIDNPNRSPIKKRLDDHPATLKALIEELETLPPESAATLLNNETGIRLPSNLVSEIISARSNFSSLAFRYRNTHPKYTSAKNDLARKEAALERELHQAFEQLRSKLRILEESPEITNKGNNHARPPSELDYVESEEERKLLQNFRRISIEQPDRLILPRKSGEPTLHYAARNGYRNLIRFFLDRGIDINLQDSLGKTVLHLAVESGNLDFVHFLLQQEGIDIDSMKPYHSTPLHAAAKAGFLAIAKSLVAEGADINAKTLIPDAYPEYDREVANYRKALHAASHSQSRWDYIQYAEDVYPRLVAQGNTPLHLSSVMGYREMSEWLITKGAEINATNRCGLTPLLNHLARSSMPLPQHLDMVKLLLKSGADPKIMGEVVTPPNGRSYNRSNPQPSHEKSRARTGLQFSVFKAPMPPQMEDNKAPVLGSWTSPLHLAPFFGSDMIRLLLDYGADASQQTPWGSTPLHSLFNQTEAQVIESFLGYLTTQENPTQIDPTATDGNGFTPVDYAIHSQQNLEAAQSLFPFVAKEKIPGYVTGRLWNYLQFANIHQESLTFLSHLIKHHLNAVNEPNHQGTLPLEYVILERPSPELTEWLLAQGAEKTLTEKLGETKALIENGQYDDRNAPAIQKLLNRLEDRMP